MRELTLSISRSVDVGNWVGDGGDGRIGVYNETKLIVHQTPHVHGEIKEYLSKLREESSKQIAIEARFILVDDNFLEDIGGQSFSPDFDAAHIIGQTTEGPANSEEILTALESIRLPEGIIPKDELKTLDDLQTELLIRATQAHSYAKTLTAPKALVLNGESATMEIQSELLYIDIDDEQKFIQKGTSLYLLPTMQNDDKEVLLEGHLQLTDVLENRPVEYNGKEYEIPYVQVANIPIHAVVINKETLLIAGPELTISKEIQNKSKIPVIGRMFTNRSIVSDKQRLLVLIKPTVIEQEEVEPDAIGALAPRPPQSGGMMGGYGGGGGGMMGGGMMGSYGGGSGGGGGMMGSDQK